MTNEELKAEMMAKLGVEVDAILKAREGGNRLTLTQIEDVVLEARQRIGIQLTEGMVVAQEGESDLPAPLNPDSGKRLKNKGKKNSRSRPGSG